MPNEIIWGIISGLGGLAIGVIGFFLKRTISRTDKHEEDIQKIRQEYATKSDLKDLKQEIKADLQKLMSDVADIKENAIGRDDFYRAQMSNEKNFQRLYDLFLRRSGGEKKDG